MTEKKEDRMITARDAMMEIINSSVSIMYIEGMIKDATRYGNSTIDYTGKLTELEVDYLRSIGYAVWYNEWTDDWTIYFTGG